MWGRRHRLSLLWALVFLKQSLNYPQGRNHNLRMEHEPSRGLEGSNASPTARPGKVHYRRRLPHVQKTGRPIFVTFRTHRSFVLPESVRQLVLEHCLHDHEKRALIHCAVVMPDHVHLLLTLMADPNGVAYSLEQVTHGIKGASAHSVNRVLGRKGNVWQDESFDRLLRSDHSIEAKSQYICDNPVRKGLAKTQDEYPWLWREWEEGEQEARVRAELRGPGA